MKNDRFNTYPFIIVKRKKRNSKVKKISNIKSQTQGEDELQVNIVNNMGTKWKFILKY